MRAFMDYLRVRPSEQVTATSDGVALSLSCPLHFVKTNGDEDLDSVTLADGRWDGERHIIAVTSLGHASDTLRITPASRPTGDFLAFGTLAVGSAVTLVWDAVSDCWQIASGNNDPAWGAVG
jgi:hypothetical protein